MGFVIGIDFVVGKGLFCVIVPEPNHPFRHEHFPRKAHHVSYFLILIPNQILSLYHIFCLIIGIKGQIKTAVPIDKGHIPVNIQQFSYDLAAFDSTQPGTRIHLPPIVNPYKGFII